jgi:uncharacterized SAM-binding protein YcdF (DUF218 family)
VSVRRRTGKPRTKARAGARLALWLVVVLVAAGVAGYPVYVRPQIDAPRAADAILVLGGTASAQRYVLGLELAHQGLAPHVVLSNPYRPADPVLDGLCARQQTGFTLECFAPSPTTTLGEGRELRRLADERGWRTVIVVTSTSHVSRARYILGKCFDGELVMVAPVSHLSVLSWAWIYAYHSAGYVKAVVQGAVQGRC